MRVDLGRDFQSHNLKIKGAIEFRSLIRTDNRGHFARHFANRMTGTEATFRVVEANISRTIQKHTFRGMHYQIPPYAESKLVSCLSGKVLDVIVDLRPQSPTYLKWESILLSEELNNSVYVPVGVANGYMSLDQNVLVHYYCSAAYSTSHERGFRFNDKLIAIQLPSIPSVVSSKDLSWGDLNELDLRIFKTSL